MQSYSSPTGLKAGKAEVEASSTGGKNTRTTGHHVQRVYNRAADKPNGGLGHMVQHHAAFRLEVKTSTGNVCLR